MTSRENLEKIPKLIEVRVDSSMRESSPELNIEDDRKVTMNKQVEDLRTLTISGTEVCEKATPHPHH